MLIDLGDIAAKTKQRFHVDVNFQLDMRPDHMELRVLVSNEFRTISYSWLIDQLKDGFSDQMIADECLYMAREIYGD